MVFWNKISGGKLKITFSFVRVGNKVALKENNNKS